LIVPHNPWSQVLSRLRDEKHLTQEQVAERGKVVRNTWQRWESKSFNPTDKNLRKAAKALDCTLEELNAAYAAHMAAPPDTYAEDLELFGSSGAARIRATDNLFDSMKRLVAETPRGDPIVDALLGPPPEDGVATTGPESCVDLLDLMHTRSTVLVASSIQILTEAFVTWPKLVDQAKEEEMDQLEDLHSELLRFLQIASSITETLQRMNAARRSSVGSEAADEELPAEPESQPRRG
jgi:transcriptional regulator with XRE-family HTH domain